jgi:hypothetical protein
MDIENSSPMGWLVDIAIEDSLKVKLSLHDQESRLPLSNCTKHALQHNCTLQSLCKEGAKATFKRHTRRETLPSF